MPNGTSPTAYISGLPSTAQIALASVLLKYKPIPHDADGESPPGRLSRSNRTQPTSLALPTTSKRPAVLQSDNKLNT